MWMLVFMKFSSVGLMWNKVEIILVWEVMVKRYVLLVTCYVLHEVAGSCLLKLQRWKVLRDEELKCCWYGDMLHFNMKAKQKRSTSCQLVFSHLLPFEFSLRERGPCGWPPFIMYESRFFCVYLHFISHWRNI